MFDLWLLLRTKQTFVLTPYHRIVYLWSTKKLLSERNRVIGSVLRPTEDYLMSHNAPLPFPRSLHTHTHPRFKVTRLWCVSLSTSFENPGRPVDDCRSDHVRSSGDELSPFPFVYTPLKFGFSFKWCCTQTFHHGSRVSSKGRGDLWLYLTTHLYSFQIRTGRGTTSVFS